MLPTVCPDQDEGMRFSGRNCRRWPVQRSLNQSLPSQQTSALRPVKEGPASQQYAISELHILVVDPDVWQTQLRAELYAARDEVQSLERSLASKARPGT